MIHRLRSASRRLAAGVLDHDDAALARAVASGVLEEVGPDAEDVSE
jgi:hypothetical protein